MGCLNDELASLAADIKEHGLREPVVLHEGLILDGRNRYQACRRAGVKPTTEEWVGHGSAAAYVVSKNLHRRHLDEGQRGLIAAKLANIAVGQVGRHHERSGGPFGPPELPKVSNEEAAELLNVSPSTVKRAKVVLTKGTREEVQAVQEGKVAVAAVAKQIHSGMTAAERADFVSQRRPLLGAVAAAKIGEHACSRQGRCRPVGKVPA